MARRAGSGAPPAGQPKTLSERFQATTTGPAATTRSHSLAAQELWRCSEVDAPLLPPRHGRIGTLPVGDAAKGSAPTATASSLTQAGSPGAPHRAQHLKHKWRRLRDPRYRSNSRRIWTGDTPRSAKQSCASNASRPCQVRPGGRLTHLRRERPGGFRTRWKRAGCPGDGTDALPRGAGAGRLAHGAVVPSS